MDAWNADTRAAIVLSGLGFKPDDFYRAYIRKYPYTVIMVSHDREMLNRSVTHTLALEHQQLMLTPGGYDDWMQLRAAKTCGSTLTIVLRLWGRTGKVRQRL